MPTTPPHTPLSPPPRRSLPTPLNAAIPLASDVEIDILYCGVCHSDLHFARNEWGMSQFPLVPGHEILGRVTRVGKDVRKFKVGDLAAVGCMVDSCRAHLRELQEGARTVLLRRRRLHLRRHGQAQRPPDRRRLLHPHCLRRGFLL